MDPRNLPKPQFEAPEEAPQDPASRTEAAGLNSGETQQGKLDELRNTEASSIAPTDDPLATNAAAVAPAHIPAAKPTAIPGVSANPAADTHLLDADNEDLIEKAWVEKAKAIVDQTKNDPHKQNQEINKVKKEYIQKRYHKNIKLSDE